MISWIRTHWYFSGTQISGHIIMYLGGLFGFLEWLSAQPGIAFLLKPTQAIWFGLIIAAIGYIVKKRGKTNAQRLGLPPPDPNAER